MKARRMEWFMIWALLGFSAGLTGLFYLLTGALLFGHPAYEDHRWFFVAALAGGGIII